MLKFRYKMRHRNLPKAMGTTEDGHGTGPKGRIERMRLVVTETVRHERIEGQHNIVDESRGYTERLIQEAIKHGDQHRATMEMADFWLKEKDLIHKLFKVLVPRYRNYTSSFTAMHNLPTEYPGKGIPMAVLELKGNPWPPIIGRERDRKYTLTNVLLSTAKDTYQQQRRTASDADKNTYMYQSTASEHAECGQDTQVQPQSPDGTPV